MPRDQHIKPGDRDLLLIAEFDLPYLKRIAELLEAVADTKIPVEIHPHIPDEALSMLEKGKPPHSRRARGRNSALPEPHTPQTQSQAGRTQAARPLQDKYNNKISTLSP